MKNIIYITYLLLITLLISCQGEDSHEGHDHSGHGHGQEKKKEENKNEVEVHLIQQQMDVMGIELGAFKVLNLSTTVKANGQLELPPQNKASVSTVLAGRVKSILVLEGDYVKKGQRLATLEHPSYLEIQQEYMTAKSKLTFLDEEFQRSQALLTDSITSKKEHQRIQSNYYATLAETNGLKAKLNLLGIDVKSIEKGNYQSTIAIRSPIAGFVRMVEINMGKYVLPEQEMFEIVDNEHIHIDLMVYERDMPKVKNGQQVIFSLATDPDEIFQGSIFSTGKTFDRATKAMRVHAEIDNKTGNLLPGMYVNARIITNKDEVHALPNDAIVSDGGLNYIFVLQPKKVVEHKGHSHGDGDHHDHGSANDHADEHIFNKMEVNLGAKDIGFTEVLPVDALPENAQIVTQGAFYLLAEMKKGEGGHGHHH